MNKSDRNIDIDSLIEEAFIEKGARKQLQALELQIRKKEMQKSKRLRRWVGFGAGAAAAAAAVVLAVVRPWNSTPDGVPGTDVGGTLAEVSGGGDSASGDSLNGVLQDGAADGTGQEAGAAESGAPVSAKDKAAWHSYLASLEPFRSGAAGSQDADIARAVFMLKEGNSPEEALKLLKDSEDRIDRRLSELEGRNDDGTFDERQELEQQKEDVRWFTALAHLSLGETGQAKAVLEEIAGGDGQYSSEASELLGKIFTEE